MESRYVKIGEAAKIIGVSTMTLRNYHQEGILIPELIMPSGHRFYSREQLYEFLRGRIAVCQ